MLKTPLNADTLVAWFQETYLETVQLMKNSDHHFDKDSLNPFHLEGDVWTHTMMVIKQVEQSCTFFYKTLLVAALLHDIGKPLVREEKNGKVYFTNHDALSAFRSLSVVSEINEFFGSHISSTEIFKLIALHTQPYKKDLLDLADETDNSSQFLKLLELAKADHAGRFSFKGKSFQFPFNHISEAQDFWEENKRVNRPKDLLKEVVVMCGLPGSGKSTYLEENFKSNGTLKRGHYIVSRDDCLIEYFEKKGVKGSYTELFEKSTKEDQKEIDKLLQEKFKYARGFSKVAVDMTHMSKKSRRRTLSHFQNRSKICVLLIPNLEEIFMRNVLREGKYISDDVYHKMMKSFYPPTEAEGFSRVIYSRAGSL